MFCIIQLKEHLKTERKKINHKYGFWMLDHVYLIVACVFSIELLIRLNLIGYVNLVIKISRKVFHIILTSRISEHWKEKVVPTYAFILLKNSLSILGVLLLIILIFLGFTILSDDLLKLIVSVTGIIESIVISLIYLKLRVIIFK